MLRQILSEIRDAEDALSLGGLSRKLGVEPSALEGMIDFLVRKGRLKIDGDAPSGDPAADCEEGSACPSGLACPGPRGCPFIVSLPRTITLVVDGETDLSG